MSELSTFGKWVKAQRNALGVCQADFARQVYCAEITLRKIEADERRPSPELALLILREFRVPQNQEQALLELARNTLPEGFFSRSPLVCRNENRRQGPNAG